MSKSYSKKARGLIIAHQAVEGIPTPVTGGISYPTSGYQIDDFDFLACFEPTYDTEISSDTLEYAGSEFSRDIRTDFTDRVMNVGCSTLMPSLGVPGALVAPSLVFFPQEVLFGCTGASVTYSGTGATSLVTVTNATTSTTKASVVVSAVSSDNNTVQKIYRGFDGNAVADLELEIDKRVKFKWNLKSIPVDWAATPEAFPDEIPKIEPDFGVQKTEVMPTLGMRQITQAQLEVYGSKLYSGVTRGVKNAANTDLPTPFGTGPDILKNFCFSKITANNLFGFSWERLHNSCQTGFEKLAVSPDVVITILEDDIQAVLQPDTNVIDGGMLEGYFAFALTFGTVAGKKVHLTFDKLQCVNVKNTEVGSRAAKELTFKNCSFSTLMWNSAA